MCKFSNRQSTLSPLTPFLPLPKYFESEWSYAQYRIPVQSSHISLSSRPSAVDLPEEERCVVGWINLTDDPLQDTPDYQLIALTFTGGWYRLSLPKAGNLSKRNPGSSTNLASGSPPKSSLGPHTRSISGSSTTGRLDKGKEKEEKKDSRNCILQEYRRFGRWDGWG